MWIMKQQLLSDDKIKSEYIPEVRNHFNALQAANKEIKHNYLWVGDDTKPTNCTLTIQEDPKFGRDLSANLLFNTPLLKYFTENRDHRENNNIDG